jgi:hypothetical protein
MKANVLIQLLHLLEVLLKNLRLPRLLQNSRLTFLLKNKF